MTDTWPALFKTVIQEFGVLNVGHLEDWLARRPIGVQAPWASGVRPRGVGSDGRAPRHPGPGI